MATGPSPRVRQEFRKYLTNTVAAEGEPAALGKSATGPVYYTDYDSVVHKNRVWFRKGSNKEIVGVARADNQGLPDVPNLPIRVARRFGSNWVVDWQRENAAVPTGGGGGEVVDDTTLGYWLPADLFVAMGNITQQNLPTEEIGNVSSSFGLGQYWVMPADPSDATDYSRVITWIIPTKSNDRARCWALFRSLGGGGNVHIQVIKTNNTAAGGSFSTSGSGITAAGDTSVAVPSSGQAIVIEGDTDPNAMTTTAGQAFGISVSRSYSSGFDTCPNDVQFLGVYVEFYSADGATNGGGATSTASGVHKFSPAQMLAAQNASETSVNSLATPAIAIPDSGATPTINVAFLAEKTSATLDVDIYAVTASGSGDVVLDADAYSGATDGTGTPTDNNGFVTDGTFAADGNIRKFTLTVAFTTQPDLTPGDYCSARIQRLVASGSDTLAADLHVLMIVVTENGDG